MQLRRSRLATLLALLVAVPLSAQDVCGRSATHRWRSTSRSPTGRSAPITCRKSGCSRTAARRGASAWIPARRASSSRPSFTSRPRAALTTDPASWSTTAAGGVGFARHAAQGTEAGPPRNPFV